MIGQKELSFAKMRSSKQVTKKRRGGGNPTSRAKKSRYEPRAIANVLNRRNIYGFPDSTITRVRYVDNLTLTSTSNALAKTVFRMNSLYDPDYTNTGHQPLYYDQLSALYGKYTVLGSKIKVYASYTAATAGSGSVGPVLVGIVGDDDASASSTLTTLQETSTSVYRQLIRQDGGGKEYLTLTYSPMKNLGLPADDDTVGASVSTNPTSAYYAVVYVQDLGLSTASSVMLTCEIEYTVKFSRLKDVTQS